jgi:SAM-dependent methyltransferase
VNCELSAVRGQFDLIMFHHVYEHLVDPRETLELARELLAEHGQILIRIPLADSLAARKYGEHWVQLDAPRHIALQTRKSMGVLAGDAGLDISRVTYDSWELQFWGSEQYLLDIPLRDPRSLDTGSSAVFSPDLIRAFAAEARTLNAHEEGDQAAFVLQRKAHKPPSRRTIRR